MSLSETGDLSREGYVLLYLTDGFPAFTLPQAVNLLILVGTTRIKAGDYLVGDP